MLKTKRKTAKTYNTVSHVFKKKKERKGQITYVLSGVWSITTLIGKNFSSLAFHRARHSCYSSRKPEGKLALNNAKKIHNCADYF